MQVGCYSLDLYCDNLAAHPCGFSPEAFTHERGEGCRKHAKRCGWRLSRSKGDLCPACAKVREFLSINFLKGEA